ncbi:hypothetical protein EBF04_21875 [Streptomyces sp. I6]|nr:hypothetical protein EBF04_21875 [Streptomyces sp. I6]
MNSSYGCFPASWAFRPAVAARACGRGRLEILDNAEFRRPAVARPTGPAAVNFRQAATAGAPIVVSPAPVPRRAFTRARGRRDGEPPCPG